MTERRRMFCARLKAAREKNGVSLDRIAASTKISRSLLAGLERGDLSRWPNGLFRRSYVRDYLAAIDVPPDPILAEFLRLFPGDAGPFVDESPRQQPEESPAFAMTLAQDPMAWMATARKRIAAAAIDGGIVISLWGLAWWAMQADVWACGALVTLGYYSVATAVLGRSVGSRCLEHRPWTRGNASSILSSAPQALRSRFRLVERLPPRPDPADAAERDSVPWSGGPVAPSAASELVQRA